MIVVHHMKVWNITNDKWEIPPSKRTAKEITAIGGVIIPETAEEIDPAQLDEHGRYFPRGAAVQVEKDIDKGTLKRKPK